MRRFTRSLCVSLVAGAPALVVGSGGAVKAEPPDPAGPDHRVLLDIASGRLALTDLVPADTGYVDVNLFEGPAEHVVTPKPHRVCHEELAFELARLPAAIRATATLMTYNEIPTTPPAGMWPELWPQLAWVHTVTPYFQLLAPCPPGFGGFVCTIGGEGEWSTVERYVFKHAEGGALRFAGLVQTDEVLVEEDAVTARLDKARATFTALEAKGCPAAPESAERLNDIGLTARRADDAVKAAHFYALAMAKDPRLELPVYNLACEHARLNESEKAIALLQTLKAMNTAKSTKLLKNAPKDEDFADMVDDATFKQLTQ